MIDTIGNNGETKTYFDGLLTQSQLFIILAVIILTVVIAINIKSILKTLVSFCLLLLCGVLIFLASPKPLRDVASKLKDNEFVEQVKTLSESSDDIKFKDGKVSVKLGNDWYSLEDIKSYVNVSEDSISINVNGQKYTVKSDGIKTLLESLSNP